MLIWGELNSGGPAAARWLSDETHTYTGTYVTRAFAFSVVVDQCGAEVVQTGQTTSLKRQIPKGSTGRAALLLERVVRDTGLDVLSGMQRSAFPRQ